MSAIVQDPLKWSGSMVSSWTRFWLFGLFYVAWLIFTVTQASTYGWRSALGPAVFLINFQLLIFYALRRLFLGASGKDLAATNPEVAMKHFAWIVAIFLTTFCVSVALMLLSRKF